VPLEESLETTEEKEFGVKWPPACEDVSQGTRESPLVKTQQTEKIYYVL
jgi:hypothetical protein